MLKTGFFLGVSNAAIALFSLIRNILIARLVGVEDFGIASTFAITMALIEMTGNLALDRLLVQARDGDGTILQSTAQALQAMRGALGAVALFLTAGLIASLFGIPEVTWAYQLLALVPLMRGLAHLDMFRLQREMRFGRSIIVDFASIAISTLVAVPLTLWLNDYRAMLYVILLHQALYLALSHLVAERGYRWGWDATVARRAIIFGWPLLLNGLLMFGIFQSDRIIVGSLIGMKELGWFSAAFALTLSPTFVIGKTLNSFFLPQLSKIQDDSEKFLHLYLVSVQAMLLSSAIYLLFFSIAGPYFFTLFYGQKYESVASLIVLLAVMQSMRIGKSGPAIVATAKTETMNPLIANLIRVTTIPIAFFAVKNGAGLVSVVEIAIIGETLALIASIYMLRSRLQLPIGSLMQPVAIYILMLGLVALGNFLFYTTPYDLGVKRILFSLPFFALLVWSMQDFRLWVRSLF